MAYLFFGRITTSKFSEDNTLSKFSSLELFSISLKSTTTTSNKIKFKLTHQTDYWVWNWVIPETMRRIWLLRIEGSLFYWDFSVWFCESQSQPHCSEQASHTVTLTQSVNERQASRNLVVVRRDTYQSQDQPRIKSDFSHFNQKCS